MKTLIEKIKNQDKYNFFYLQDVIINGVVQRKKEKARYFVTNNNTIAKYGKGRRRVGYAVEDVNRIVVEDKKNIKTAERRWNDSWVKVINRLQLSGLYVDLLANAKVALEIGYDKIQTANEIYWKQENKRDDRVAAIKKIDERLIHQTEKKGKMSDTAKTEIIWYMSRPAAIKKMNFGKYSNDEKLSEIKKAMTNKKEIKMSGRTNYDISFSYSPLLNKAWYSEEFRNCGNGHYYLALDSTHALFYEDD